MCRNIIIAIRVICVLRALRVPPVLREHIDGNGDCQYTLQVCALRVVALGQEVDHFVVGVLDDRVISSGIGVWN